MTTTDEHLPTGDERIEKLRRDPITRHYALDQMTDVEKLRLVAHLLAAGFQAAHQLHQHDVEVLLGDVECAACKAHQDSFGETDRCAEAEVWRAAERRAWGGR